MSRFTVLMVCLGNICRSPMAERLLVSRLTEAWGSKTSELIHVHGAGTGTWHIGEPMNPPAAEEIRRRGGEPDDFRARGLSVELIEMSDLILTATIEQTRSVAELVPSASSKTFVVGEFGRLASQAKYDFHPNAVPTVDEVKQRGLALIGAIQESRDAARRSDEVPDPWGLSQEYFASVADQIEEALSPLIAALGCSTAPDSPLTMTSENRPR